MPKKGMRTAMMMKKVDFSLDEGVAIIRMDDGKANALSPEMIRALEEALERARTEASAVVLDCEALI